MMAAAELTTWLWRALVHCPPASLFWASLAYRVGVLDGQEQLRRQLGADLHQAGRGWVEETGWKPGRPSHAELQRRRGEPVDQVRRNLHRPSDHNPGGNPR